ncbi:ubiquitin-specific protease ubp2 [Pleosporales sp. CAS-2024a]
MAPGKTAPRLLQDLLTYDPRFEERAGRNILTSAPPHFDPNRQRTPAVPARNCRHALLLKPEQSALPHDAQDPGAPTACRVASYCSQCRWHIDVVVASRGHAAKTRPCRRGDGEFLLHHFLFQGEGDENGTSPLGFPSAPRKYTFTCSAPQCPVTVHIHMRPPHLSDHDIETLTNSAKLRRRWEDAKQTAGDRADTTMARSVDGPDYLSTYLLDSLNPVKGKTRIPLLNKKFFKTFGRDCDSILTRLGFTTQLEDESDPQSQVWYLPRPQEAQGSEATAARDIIQDVRYELNTIILNIPEHERHDVRHKPMFPAPSAAHIERALACDNYDKVKGRAASNNHEEDHPFYAGIGAVGDFSDALILFAFAQQTAVDVENRAYYYECLSDLAVGRKSEELQMQVAMYGSQGFASRRELDAAYRSFGIEPAHAVHLNDEHIIGTFRSRLSDISPHMADEARRQLRIIGDARNSDAIRAEASDAMETYEQALSWLDLTAEQADDFIPTMVALKTSDNPATLETARKAVSIIAEHRNSARLRQWLKDGHMDQPEMDLGEAYALFSISDRTAKVDFDVMKTTIAFAPADSAEKMQKAYQMIEQDQATNHNNRSNQSEVRRNSYPLETWPVGLRNIGNTCYLNSVLQFLFTIKPLRDMVLDCDNYLQDPTPDAIIGKKVGRTVVTAQRVEVAQKFIRELRTFFKHMITAPTDTVQPAIDLAALALCKTDTPQSEVNAPESDEKKDDGAGPIEGAPAMSPMPAPMENNSEALKTSSADSVMGDDDKSDTSMQAMDMQDATEAPEPTASAQPPAPSRPPPIPPRPAAPTKTKLGNIEESARQQDAAEVLSNIFDLFSCAIKGKGVLRENEQLDMIKELFFSDVTSVRNIKPKPEESYELRDHFLVSPGWRDRNLYATLDDDFGLSELDGGVTKYDYIQTAAPVQIINLRRLQFDRVKGEQVYDRSHIGLEKTLYLDRYLAKTQSLSQLELLKLREAQWEKQGQLRRLEHQRDTLRRTNLQELDLADVVDEASAFIRDLSKQYEEQPDGALPIPPPELADALAEKASQLKKDLAQIDAEMTRLETDIDGIFKNSHDHPYRLHAIFTHRGGTKGGHYWIYIYDFQNGLWRKYNDDHVTLANESDIFEREIAVMPSASTGVVYIREDQIDAITEAVRREPASPEDGSAQTQSSDVHMQDVDARSPLEPVAYSDVQIIDGIEKV